jgi:hypothetical protein
MLVVDFATLVANTGLSLVRITFDLIRFWRIKGMAFYNCDVTIIALAEVLHYNVHNYVYNKTT